MLTYICKLGEDAGPGAGTHPLHLTWKEDIGWISTPTCFPSQTLLCNEYAGPPRMAFVRTFHNKSLKKIVEVQIRGISETLDNWTDIRERVINKSRLILDQLRCNINKTRTDILAFQKQKCICSVVQFQGVSCLETQINLCFQRH